MAQITIQFPDGIGSRVNNLLGRRWKYQETIPDPADVDGILTLPNPQSRTAFNKQRIVDFVKSEAVEQEVSEAGAAAASSQRPTSVAELDLTSV